MIILLLVLIVLIFALNTQKRGGTNYKRRFGKHYKLGKLLTKNEYGFYMNIRKRIASNILIFPKVRMEDFLDVIATNNYQYRGYVRCRHVDFLVCDETLHILCAIELDDSSHNTKQARQVDRLKNDIFKEIKVPLLRCYNNKKDVEYIVNEVTQIASRRGKNESK